MIERLQEPYLNTREDSAFRFLGLPTLMRSTTETTNGAFGLMEHWMMPPGFASPYHTHHREDEAFYVLEGEVAFVCDGKWLKAGPGTYAFGPRGIPHGFKIVGSGPARMLPSAPRAPVCDTDASPAVCNVAAGGGGPMLTAAARARRQYQ